MTALTPIETRRAGHGEGSCPVCRDGIAAGQRVALVRSDDIDHAWVHLRCLVEGRCASATVTEPDGPVPA